MTHSFSEKSFQRIIVALAIYLTALFAANTLGLKVMPFLFGSHLSVGIFSFPIVFLMTDVIGEVYGKKVAKQFVLAGIISTALFVAYSLLSLWMPWSEGGLWAKEGYETIFGVSTRIAIASLVAFALAQYQDVFSFFFLRKKFDGRFLWLRSTLSNLWSQWWDTVIFNAIAFIGVYSWPMLLSITLTWWLYKVAMGMAYSPLLYLGVKLLRGEEKKS